MMKNIILTFLLFLSCRGKDSVKSINPMDSGISSRGIPYNCVGCKDYLKDTILLNKSINLLDNDINLQNIERIEIYVEREDTLYNDNRRVDKLISFYGKYHNTVDVFTTPKHYILNDDINDDVVSKFKKEKLKIINGSVNRDLLISKYTSKIEVMPFKDGSLTVISSIKCSNKGDILSINTENGYIKLKSINNSNCENISYYQISKNEKSKLKLSKLKSISLKTNKEFLEINVPENDKDYFIQYFSLIN